MSERSDLVREITDVLVARIGGDAGYRQHYEATVTAILGDIERAGYRVVPAVSADIPLRLFKEARHGR